MSREEYAAKLRKELSKPRPVCKHEETAVVITPIFDGGNGVVIDDERQECCTKCGAFVRRAL